MIESAFNESATAEALSTMAIHQQLALGAACCERQLSDYERFQQEVRWGHVGPLRRALDAIWEACGGTRPIATQLRELRSTCEHCVPDSDDFASLHTSSAQDAGIAICALLEFLLDGNPGQIARAIRFATDSIDLIVQKQEDMDPQDPLRERRILEHPLMQQELVRQRRDLEEVRALAAGKLLVATPSACELGENRISSLGLAAMSQRGHEDALASAQ